MISVTQTERRSIIRVEGDGDVFERIHSAGDEVQILIKENGSTGYVWTVESADLPLLHDERFGNDPQAMGGQYDRSLVFTAPTPGSTSTFILVLNRPWAGDEPTRTVHISVMGVSQK